MQITNVASAYKPVHTSYSSNQVASSQETGLVLAKDTVEISEEAKRASMGRKNIEFFGEKAYGLLKIRGIKEEEIAEYSEIVTAASEASDKRQFLLGLDTEQRDLVKRANSYGSKLTDSNIASFSDEGVYNMLTSQRKRDFKDFNNDGIVEHGNALSVVFPPPNASDHVHEAYEELTKDMDFKEKMLFEANFMTQSLEANFKYDSNNNVVGRYEPGDKEYVNIYAGNDDATWKNVLNSVYDYFDFLESRGEGRPEDRKLVEDFENLIFGNKENN